MSGRLAGKVAIISGAARGQGAAHAAAFTAEGAKVILGDILDEQGERHAAALRDQGHEALYAHLDVTDARSWADAVGLARDRFGELDVLVNNAGIVAFAGAADVSDDEWQRITSVNQTGVALGMRAALPSMLARGAGSIVNVSSNLAMVGVPGYFAYQASKGAVSAMTRASAVEYAGSGIRINAICPGLVISGMTAGEPPEAVQAIVDLTPLGRAGQPEEIAHAAVFLASDESSFMTGSELVIDGGYAAQ